MSTDSTNADSDARRPYASDAKVQIRQAVTGDRNQAIGQVLGGIVVYVSGGQAVFHSASADSGSSASQLTPLAIGSNPYKGLMAFQETDRDRFFGRKAQIVALWKKLRHLHETEAAIRILPIYGPSGSGKSSLARAGLIPELARYPIPGYDRARVAVLVPGTHPLEALATILARIVTQDLTPVAKTREFAGELKQLNAAGEHDGLRRIADVMPEVVISPLIVLVDQFEEVYTLCEDKAEQKAFVENLLCAAAERSKRVSVIITLRSDFLGETQKHPALNALFAEQGFLVRSMSEAELRQAIAKPAELAEHPLDQATINLLIKDTEGREGALPLLQFALTQIWEGLAEGKEPVETLKAIGGVGGALAGEAQRIYQQLSPAEQDIARRIFLGLVQLGEGTKDTRRRARLDSLISHRDQRDQVNRVIQLFSAPGARLITLSAVRKQEAAEATHEALDLTETAEVTHEALLDHWQQLRNWLEGSRSDIRFQRRLDEAARYWQEQGRPEGYLWRPPALDLLKQYQQRAGEDMTPLQIEFFEASQELDENRKRQEAQYHRFQKRAIFGLSTLSTGAMIFAGFALNQLQQAQHHRVEQLAATAEALLSTQHANAEIAALAVVELSHSPWLNLPYSMPQSDFRSLLHSVLINKERNLLPQPYEGVPYSVAFSPDGKTIVSSNGDGQVRLWNVSTGQLIWQTLQGHEDEVVAIAFSPDGKTIASGSLDKTVRLWNASTGELIGHPLQGHEGWVWSVAFSPDSKMIVSGSFDKTIRLWDASTGEPIGKPLQGHKDKVLSVAFSPDGRTIASGSFDNTVCLWNASTRQLIKKLLQEHEGGSRSVAFSSDSKTIVSGGDKTLRLWDISTGQPLGQPLRGHEDDVLSVAFSPDGKTIVSGSADKTVRLWSASTGQLIGQPLRGHDSLVWSVAFSPDGKTIVSSSFDSTLRLWSDRIDQPIGQPLQGHQGEVRSVAFSPDGKTIVSGSRDGTVRLWNASTGQPIGQPLQGHQGEVRSVAFSPDGKTIASGSWDRTIRLWNASTGQPIGHSLRGHKNMIFSIAFSPDGKTIASGSWDRTIRLWSTSTGQPIGYPLQGHEGIIWSVVFSPDGKTIASGSSDKTVRLWNASTGQPIGYPLQGHEDVVWSVVFSPDGKTIASGSSDKTVRLWSTSTGQLIGQPLKGHESWVISVAFSPDGKTIASGSSDKTVRLWNASTGQPLGKPLKGREEGVTSVAFNPDGKTIVSSSAKTLRLWLVSWDDLIETACTQLQHHSSLLKPKTDVAKEAKQTCKRYAWNK